MADDASKSPAPTKSPSPKPRPASKSTSKPSSAKSGTGSQRTGSARSQKSTARSASQQQGRTPSPKGKPKGKGKKKEEEKAVTPTAEGEEDEGLPEGCIPLFMASKTQEIFECRADEDVTEDSPLKMLTKKSILSDLYERAAVSDFHPIKQIIQDYPEEEILIGYDPDFKYGQNFFIATTEEAKQRLLKKGGSDAEGEGGEAEEEEEVIYKYVPPVSKPWVSHGAEKEIEEESLVENRKRMKLCVRKRRREFGAPFKFVDRNVADAKDGFIECSSYEDKTFDLKRIELTKAIQAIPEFRDSSAQTEWKFPRNASCQYTPRELPEEDKTTLESAGDLEEFIKSAIPRFDLSLQQNEIMDVFYDDWANLNDDDSSFGSKADNHLKEYQSFTDLQFSKEKTVTHIEWHPSLRGVVAVSVGERLTFEDRIEQAARVIMTPSLILIWSFSDPIHPQLLLEAPEDIVCFRFSPTDANIIAGGCINGQVVMWDISAHAERLKQPRNKRKDNINTLPGFEDPSALETPIVRYCAVSSIEHSHKAPITDLLWVPDHMEVTRMGVPQENKSGQNVQLMTCAVDHSVLFWDIRPPKTAQHHEKKKDELKNPMGVPDTFKHLDLTWKPHLKVHLYKSEPGGDHSPTTFTIAESQGDKSVLSGSEEAGLDKRDSSLNTSAGGFALGKPSSGQAKRTLAGVNTHFYIGTEDGEIVYADWMPQKDSDSGKIQTPKPDYYHTMHDGPIISLQRSPFFKDIILCVGGWRFSIWKEGILTGAIVLSSASNKKLTSGYWSPSRPAVFFITREDGSVDIWDLLDRTHEPSMNQGVSPAPITAIYPHAVTNKQHLLAVGDNAGTLHILEIPWSLRQPTPNEMVGVANYFEREVKRRGFVMARWDFREKEKMELEIESKKRAGIAPNIQLSEEEVEMRMKMEYQQFVEEEGTFLRELGLKEEEDDPLPSTD